MKAEHLINGIAIFAGALNHKFTGKRIPLMVSLGLTNRCNLSCPFCYARDSGMTSSEFSTEQVIGCIDQFIRLGTRIFLLQGGEPLLHKGLGDIICYVKSRRRFCRISTNGMLVAEKIDSLTGVDQISFSLDGNQEVADSIRGKGVYEKVIRGMDAAYEKSIPFEIHASLIRESALNRGSIMHLLELARKYQTYVSFCIACVTGAEHTRSTGSGDLSAGEIKEFYGFLIELKKKGYPVSNSFNSLHKTLQWPISYSQIGFADNLPRGFKFMQCKHGKLICWLDAGNVLYPCPICYFRPESCVRVENSDIQKAWQELGKKVHCIACSGSDESTAFFNLQPQDLWAAFVRMARGHPHRGNRND